MYGIHRSILPDVFTHNAVLRDKESRANKAQVECEFHYHPSYILK